MSFDQTNTPVYLAVGGGHVINWDVRRSEVYSSQAWSINPFMHRIIIILVCLGQAWVTLVKFGYWSFYSLKYASFDKFYRRNSYVSHSRPFSPPQHVAESPVTLEAAHYRLCSHKKERPWILVSPLGLWARKKYILCLRYYIFLNWFIIAINLYLLTQETKGRIVNI